MILVISYYFIILHILLNIVITLKSQNLESNKVIVLLLYIMFHCTANSPGKRNRNWEAACFWCLHNQHWRCWLSRFTWLVCTLTCMWEDLLERGTSLHPLWGITAAIKSKNDHAYKIAYLKCTLNLNSNSKNEPFLLNIPVSGENEAQSCYLRALFWKYL